MSWQDLGSIGEFVSAIAVVISLVYLAFQIRQNTSQIDQNTKAVQASALDSGIGHAMDTRRDIFVSEEVSAIFLTGSADPESLTEHELLRYRLLVQNILWSLWNLHTQSLLAEMAAETWATQTAILDRLFLTKGVKWFWANYSDEFGMSFQQEVNRLLAEKND